MNHEIKDDQLQVTDDLTTIASLMKKEYYPKVFSGEIQASNVVLIPEENFRDLNYPVFPEQTMKFYDFLKDNKSDKFKPTICIDDDGFCEIEMHADFITLSTIIILHVALPILTKLIASYLYDVLRRRRVDLKVEISIIVEKEGKSKKIDYKGKAEDFEKCINVISEKIFKD
jgi:hypothetical protein